jgi:Hypoxia induced protein conserved region
MNIAVNVVLIIALAAVAIVLMMGLWNMLRGGDANLSQKLMRARVILQAIAIALLMGALFFFGRRGG